MFCGSYCSIILFYDDKETCNVFEAIHDIILKRMNSGFQKLKGISFDLVIYLHHFFRNIFKNHLSSKYGSAVLLKLLLSFRCILGRVLLIGNVLMYCALSVVGRILDVDVVYYHPRK
jgi:hypothetical protein